MANQNVNLHSTAQQHTIQPYQVIETHMVTTVTYRESDKTQNWGNLDFEVSK